MEKISSRSFLMLLAVCKDRFPKNRSEPATEYERQTLSDKNIAVCAAHQPSHSLCCFFVLSVGVFGCLCGFGWFCVLTSFSAPQQKLDPKDPQAVSLAYTENTSSVDAKKYPKHDNSQVCSGCQLYQSAQAADNMAPCTIFGGKAVAAKGWCSAYVKKAS